MHELLSHKGKEKVLLFALKQEYNHLNSFLFVLYFSFAVFINIFINTSFTVFLLHFTCT